MRHWTDSSGLLALRLTDDEVASVAHSGDNEPAVLALLAKPEVAAQVADWDAENVRSNLREYGAWDDAELAEDERNIVRTLWLAAWDLHEEPTNDAFWLDGDEA